MDEEGHRPPFGVVWTGRYAEHLRRFRSHFPVRQMHVAFYEDYTADPQATLRGMFSFLDVDADRVVDVRIRHNATNAPRLWRLHPLIGSSMKPALGVLPERLLSPLRRWYYTPPPPLTPNERARVIAIYDDDIRVLETMVGRDLASWRR